MSKTIEFGAFLNGTPSQDRLHRAQAAADSLGVQVRADGSRFSGVGRAGDPVKVTVVVPSETVLTTEAIQRGVEEFDALLNDDERLTDYALVRDNGVLTEVVSLLTAESKSVAAPAQARPVQQAQPERPRRRVFGRSW